MERAGRARSKGVNQIIEPLGNPGRFRSYAFAWIATFKSELVDGRRFPGFERAEHETLHWISFYNEQRLHEELGDLPPVEYEQLNYRRDNTLTLSAR